MTDYTEEILALLRENSSLQKPMKAREWEVQLVDWTVEETYARVVNGQTIDYIIATDVIYKGSPYDHLCKLIRHIADSQTQKPEILIIIPKQRDCRDDFLDIMKTKGGFDWTIQELEGDLYRLKALDNEKESDRYYPGLLKLNFDLYSFKLT